jgi:hypothetical protein
MVNLMATSNDASPWLYVFGGALLFVVGLIMASDYRGIATKYTQLLLPKLDTTTPARSRLIKLYRILYGFAAVVGLGMFVSGVFSL